MTDANERSYFEVVINETGAQQEEDGTLEFREFNVERKSFRTLVEAQAWIVERYASFPQDDDGDPEARKIFRDTADGAGEQVGVLYRFKNRDWSHGSAEWEQEDWVCVDLVTRKVVPFWEVNG